MTKPVSLVALGSLGASIFFYNTNALVSLIAFAVFLLCMFASGKL